MLLRRPGCVLTLWIDQLALSGHRSYHLAGHLKIAMTGIWLLSYMAVALRVIIN